MKIISMNMRMKMKTKNQKLNNTMRNQKENNLMMGGKETVSKMFKQHKIKLKHKNNQKITKLIKVRVVKQLQ